MKKRIIFALTLIGFTSMASQIVLMRELLVIFYGNELSLGITLFCWLFGTALGSWVLGKWLISRSNSQITVFCFGQIDLVFVLFLSVLGVRFIPGAFNFSPGEIIGILPITIATCILLFPVCILIGCLFVLGCEIHKGSLKGAVRIGQVYIFEAIGAAVGGLITSLFLIRFLTPLHIISLVGLLNLFSVFLLLWKKRISALFVGLACLGFIFAIFSGTINTIRDISLSKQWSGYELLTSVDSIYGNISVTKRENLYSVFVNGLYDFSVPDELTSQMSVHFPLLEHPDPKDILLIGGGLSGRLKEVLKHSVSSVDYVELDPELVKVAKEYLPPNKALNDKRVRVITNMDGRLFIKRTKQRYDVVIINLPEPYTAQLNRFYTEEFYKEVERVLRDRGILSFSLRSNPNYISQEQSQLYMTLKNTLDAVFPDLIITPGATNYFVASKQKNLLTLDRNILIDRLNKRGIEAQYMREYYLYSELSQERIDFFQDRLEKSQFAAINRDFQPIAYYYDMVLWSSFFKYSLKNVFKSVSPRKIYIVSILLFILLFIPVGLRKRRPKFSNWPVLLCVATTGFAEISFQIITLITFQVLYGYVYYKLGIILTSFMIGLIIGGLWVNKIIDRGKGDRKLFIKTQWLIFIYPLILPVLFWLFLNLKGKVSFWLGSNIIFAFLPVIPGIIGGFQFPLANKLYLEDSNSGTGRSASLIYGLDLFGACLGAVVVTIFLLPIIGIPMTCLLVAGLNVIGLLVLYRVNGDGSLARNPLDTN